MTTIKDIAKITGVSVATVSNVLNGKQGAAGPAKAREIFEVAKSLNYQPNSLAKNLKIKRTHTIGIITEDLTVFNTPEIVDGINSYCEDNDYEIILANMRLFKRYNNDFTDTPKHHQLFNAMVRNLLSKQVEGIIYVGYHCREISYTPTILNIPFVYTYCFPRMQLYPFVLFDDEKAAHDVMTVLMNKGHKSIGIICGPLSSNNAQRRLLGVQNALFENGVLYDARKVQYGDWSRLSGYHATDALLECGVSAIFAFNDMMASGVHMRCMERGLSIGKDISLFGFDNVDLSEGSVPAISSVAPPLNEMGRKSAQLVLSRRDYHEASSQPIFLPCTLHIRESVAEHADNPA